MRSGIRLVRNINALRGCYARRWMGTAKIAGQIKVTRICLPIGGRKNATED